MRQLNKVQWFLLIVISITISASFFFSKNAEEYYVPKTTGSTTASYILPPQNHVTKSLAQLGKMDKFNSHVLFLNQVPQCGAEILILLLQNLQGLNNYRHVRLKGGANKLSKLQQEDLVYEMYDIIKNEAIPLSFDRHVYFINFTLFDKQLPTYINLIRDPIDKVVARLYKNKLLNCILQMKNNCNLKRELSKELSIPFFCGHDKRCLIPNSNWALTAAKENVEKYYSVVGVLEELNSTLEVIESKVPYFFKGVQKAYSSELLQNFKRKTASKISNTIRTKLEKILDHEYDFYNWIKSRLFSQLQIIYGDHNAH